jgi:hypothetical protein
VVDRQSTGDVAPKVGGMTSPVLGTQFIGAAGELLVQYKLLKYGIDSARLTTDSGIDLVMYVPGTKEAATIQVKSVAVPKSATAKGLPIVGVGFPHSCKAQWLAICDLSRDRAWLLMIEKARELAQQHNAKGLRQLYWTVGSTEQKGVPHAESDMEPFRIEVVAQELLAHGLALI